MIDSFKIKKMTLIKDNLMNSLDNKLTNKIRLDLEEVSTIIMLMNLVINH